MLSVRSPARLKCRCPWLASINRMSQQGFPEIEMGIGINTGEVVVGEIVAHANEPSILFREAMRTSQSLHQGGTRLAGVL